MSIAFPKGTSKTIETQTEVLFQFICLLHFKVIYILLNYSNDSNFIFQGTFYLFRRYELLGFFSTL